LHQQVSEVVGIESNEMTRNVDALRDLPDNWVQT